MTARVSLGDTKFAVDALGTARVSAADTKFAVEATGVERVSLGLVKFAIRFYPVNTVLSAPPPVNITRSQAPYVRYGRIK